MRSKASAKAAAGYSIKNPNARRWAAPLPPAEASRKSRAKLTSFLEAERIVSVCTGQCHAVGAMPGN